MPSLGLGYIAAVSVREGHAVTILNCIKERMGLEGFSDYLRSRRFDIIGFQMFSHDVTVVQMLLKVIEALQPAAVVVAGGAHPSGDPYGVMEALPELDFAFKGEAEIGFVRFLQVLEKGGEFASVPGLVYREDGEIVANEPQMVEELDTLPMPAWDLLQPETYPEAPHGAFTRNFPTAPIIITRGCPSRCTFCSGKTITGTLVRKRSVANVMKEIQHLAARGVREFHIEDENFTLNKKLAMEFCESLQGSGLNMSWSLPSGVRIDTLDDELLDQMERSGCYSLALGIEFGSNRTLAATRKGLTVELVRKKLELFRGRRIKVTGFFLLGLPGETLEEMEKTIELALELPLDRAQFNNFMPLPGSVIWEDLRLAGRLEHLDWKRFFVHDVAYCDDGIRPGQIKQLQRRAYLRFYVRPRIMMSLIREIRSLSHLKFLLRRFIDALT
jgi:anaerobic magnesium-protoporphyrin IX monomethyl ester cyclase